MANTYLQRTAALLSGGAALMVVNCVLGAPSDDLSNERIPSTTLDLEQHWQVDCEATRQSLRQGAPVDASALAPLLATLNKCAMIHNVPGTPAQGSCPDYAAARDALRYYQQHKKSNDLDDVEAHLTCN